MKRTNPDKHYLQYYNLIQSILWNYRFKEDKDILLSEINEAYLDALKTYDPDKGSFCTHFYWNIKGKLSHYKKPLEYLEIQDNLSINATQIEDFDFKERINSLSNEAKEVVETCLNTPLEVIELAKQMKNNCKITMRVLRRYFAEFKHWKHSTITLVFNEIKGIL